MLYPWQQLHWQRFSEHLDKNRLGHSWMLLGREGIGKQQYALHFARWVMCQDTSNTPCGQCQSCRWWAQDAHPDFIMLPEGDEALKIDEVRELTQQCLKPAHLPRPKVVIIRHVDSLSHIVANALLKTLEEPQVSVLFILMASSSTNVLSTIVSRTFSIHMPEPSIAEANAFLQNLPNIVDEKCKQHFQLMRIPPITISSWVGSDFCEKYGHILKPFFRSSMLDTDAGAKVFHDNPKESLYLLYNWLSSGLSSLYVQHKAENSNTLFKPITGFIHRHGLQTLWKYLERVTAMQANIIQVTGVNKHLMYESLVYRFHEGIVDE